MPRSDTSDSVATWSDSLTGRPGMVTARSSRTPSRVGARPPRARSEPEGPAARTPSMATNPEPVDVVLPCLDEAGSLPWVLSRLPAGYRGIVADNGSTDGSGEIAAAHGATVVPVPQRGFGAAAHAGLEAATAEFVCFCDADGSMDPAQLPRVLDPVRAGHHDLVLGRRRPVRGAWPFHARVANLALARMLRARTGQRLHDLGPMRAA